MTTSAAPEETTRSLGDAGDDILVPDVGNDTIDGGLGIDHVNYVVVTVGGVNIDLAAGTANSNAGNDTLVGIERATGTNFDDIITGDAADNVLAGLQGADTIAAAGGQRHDLSRQRERSQPSTAGRAATPSPTPARRPR